eukprot:Gb_06008 [translate_table: standard]
MNFDTLLKGLRVKSLRDATTCLNPERSQVQGEKGKRGLAKRSQVHKFTRSCHVSPLCKPMAQHNTRKWEWGYQKATALEMRPRVLISRAHRFEVKGKDLKGARGFKGDEIMPRVSTSRLLRRESRPFVLALLGHFP